MIRAKELEAQHHNQDSVDIAFTGLAIVTTTTFPIFRAWKTSVARARLSTAGAIAAAGIATAFASIGNPSLRHDWFPTVPGLLSSLHVTTGWSSVGMGSPVGYPASFLLTPILATIAAFSSSFVAHIVFMLTIALVTAFGARRLARRIGATPAVQIAAAFFALFNPWFYTKLVSGQGFMLLAYGATYWLVAESLARRANVRVLAFSVVFIAPQIQFLVLNTLIFLMLALRSREYRPLTVVIATFFPVAVGILTSRSTLLGIPITTQWELGQSVYPFAGTLLRGYFTLYDVKLDPFLGPAMWAIVGLATLGAIDVLMRGRQMRWLVMATTAALLVSFGLHGPLAGPLAFSIQHVPETGLFRELYDLLGYAAIGYCALCCALTTRLRLAIPVFFCVATSLAVIWFAYPPNRYWIDRGLVPHPELPAVEHVRVAFMPAVAPLQFGDRGSGVDPDVHPYDNDVAPLNEATPQFPISSALGDYLLTGSTRRLGALSVAEVIDRPWLRSDIGSLSEQLAFLPRASTFERLKVAGPVLGFVPELTLSPPPRVGTLNSTQGAGNIFFADAARAAGISTIVPPHWRSYRTTTVIRAPNRFVRARDGWVDARFGFLEQPELGQALGGALTTRRDVLLHVEGGPRALVWVRGRLIAQNGKTLARTTSGYQWVGVPLWVSGVRCDGECVVAAQGYPPHDTPLEPAAQPFRITPFRMLMPWLVTAEVPPGPAQLLRYNVRYDGGWTAFVGGTGLPHLRIDSTVNGWLLPARTRRTKVVIIQKGAVAITLAEVASLLLQVSIFVSILRPRRRRALGAQNVIALEVTA